MAVFFLSDRSELTVRRTLYADGERPSGMTITGNGPNVLFSGKRTRRRKEEVLFCLCVVVVAGSRGSLAYIASSDISPEVYGCIRWLLGEWGVDVDGGAVVLTEAERQMLGIDEEVREIGLAESVPGTSIVEAAEVYALQGELVPVLWPDDTFVPWVEDLVRR